MARLLIISFALIFVSVMFLSQAKEITIGKVENGNFMLIVLIIISFINFAFVSCFMLHLILAALLTV